MTLRVSSMALLERMLGAGKVVGAPARKPASKPKPVLVVRLPAGPWPKVATVGTSLCVAFPLPGPPLSANHRIHWAEQSERTALWRSTASTYARRGGKGMPASFVTVLLPSGVKDAANLAPTCKAVIDGLVDAGWWVDDPTEVVHQMQPHILARDGIVAAVCATPMGAGIRAAFDDASRCAEWIAGLPG